LQIQVSSPGEVGNVIATIVASVDGKEIGRLETQLRVRDAIVKVPVEKKSLIPIVPLAPGSENEIRRLVEPFSDVKVGGDGHYLIFHLPKLRKLAVFDVNEAKVANYIPLSENKVSFAAGLDKVVIGLVESKTIERWSLSTFEREVSVESSRPIGAMEMGHALERPRVHGWGSTRPGDAPAFVHDCTIIQACLRLGGRNSVHRVVPGLPGRGSVRIFRPGRQPGHELPGVGIRTSVAGAGRAHNLHGAGSPQ
jgi:hypothetical protein